MVQQQSKTFYDIAADRLAALNSNAGKVSPGTPAYDALKLARKALGDVVGATDMARAGAEQIRHNAEMYPAGRQAKIREMRAAFSDSTRQNLMGAELMLDTAKRALADQASRRLDRRDAMTARADAQMILNSVKPEERASKMAELARGDNDVAALVASEWGRQYLDAKGTKTSDLSATHDAVVKSHLQGALHSSDDDRRAAAELYFDPAPAQALAAARGAVGAAESEMDTAVSQLDGYR